MGLSTLSNHLMQLSVEQLSVMLRRLTQAGVQYVRLQRNEGNGHAGAVAVGRHSFPGILLLLTELEQTVYHILLMGNGIQIPIVKKPMAGQHPPVQCRQAGYALAGKNFRQRLV